MDAATAAIMGGFVGAAIGALATWVVARGNREEARRTRFHDRVLELAAGILDSGNRFMADYQQAAIHAHLRQPSPPAVRLDPTFGPATQGLRLIVRLPATHEAIHRLWEVVTVEGRYEPSDLEGDGMFYDWQNRSAEYPERAAAFEDAIRAELGLDRLDRLPLNYTTWTREENPIAEEASSSHDSASPSA